MQLHTTTSTYNETIANYIIESLNSHGFFDLEIQTVLSDLKCSKTQFEETLSFIQTFEPIGVAAKNSIDSLMIQLKEKGYTIEYCKVDANISQENNDSGIKKITLKLDKKEETRIDENSKANENTTETIENKIVSEIQKIQKVEVKVGNNTKENSTENENSKITKTDIESVKEFLISEYGVSKSCLKIN